MQDRYSNCRYCGAIIRWYLVWSAVRKKEQWIPRNPDGTTHVESGMSVTAGKKRIKTVETLNAKVKASRNKRRRIELERKRLPTRKAPS